MTIDPSEAAGDFTVIEMKMGWPETQSMVQAFELAYGQLYRGLGHIADYIDSPGWQKIILSLRDSTAVTLERDLRALFACEHCTQQAARPRPLE